MFRWIISSSKSACYLCDLFIQIHGEFHILRTHGRVYDRWIIPEWPVNDPAANGNILSVVDRLNATLEAEILRTLSHQQRPFPHPDESVLLLREPWSSNSTLFRAPNQESIQEITDRACNGSSGDQAEPSSNSSPCSPATLTTCTERDKSDAQHRTDETQENVHLSRPIAVFCRLSRGESTCFKLINQHDTSTVQTDLVIVHASWDSKFIDTAYDPIASNGACWVQVKWLAQDNQNAHNAGSFELVDINSLASNQDTIVEGGAGLNSKELSLQIERHTLLIKYTIEGPVDVTEKGQ